jgi:poly(hydroxyalkanoate) depolymerase family esterase
MSNRRVAALASAALIALSFAARPAAAQGTFATQTIQGRTCMIYTPTKPVANPPLIVMLHGCTQNPTDFSAGTQMNVVAEKLGWVVVYPEQPSSANQNECWNWFVAADQARDQGEPALLAAITQQVVQQSGCDPKRVYVAGISAGAAMSVILGATYPDIFAAIGVCSGLEYAAATSTSGAYTAMASGGPSPQTQGDAAWAAMGSAARLVPVMVFHGSSDYTVATVNGEQIVEQWLRTDDLAPNGQPHGKLSTTPTHTTKGTAPGGDTYTLNEYCDPTGRTIVAYCLVDGMGHAWSGGSTAGSYTEPKGPDASTMLTQFFAANTLTGAAPAGTTTTTTTTTTTPPPATSTTTQPPVTVADPPGGTYTGSVSVTLRPNRTATTYYTLDGSTPTKSSSVATAPITLAAQAATSLVSLHFFSVDTAGNVESVREERYTLVPGTPATTGPCPCLGPTKTAVLASQASDDGWVGRYAAYGLGSGSPLIGDFGTYGGESFRGLLSFDTSSIPSNAHVLSVKLLVCRESVVGTINGVTVDVNEGAFSGSTAIEAADYGAAATFTGVAQFAVPSSDGSWAEVDLPAATFPAVISGLTQVRLREGTAAGYTLNQLQIHGANDTSYAPQLVVVYQN